MGRGSKKKFVDKKNAATFSLVFRESSSSNDPGTRVFVRTDGGMGHVPGFSDDYHPTDSDQDLGSGVTHPADLFGRGRLGLAGSCGRALAGRGGPAGRFGPSFGPDSDDPGAELAGQGADVEGDADEDEDSFWGADGDDDMEENDWRDWQRGGAGASPLPESVRAEILELGFPDDGYDYTQHLRTMGPAAAGDGTGRSLAAFIPAALPSAPRLPPDVKMYDARHVSVAPDSTASNATDTNALMCHISSNLRELRGTQHRNGLAPSQQSLGGAAAAAGKGIGGGGGDVGLPVAVEGDCGNNQKETIDDQNSCRTANGKNAAADDDEPSVLLLDDDVLAELEAAEAEAEAAGGVTLDQLLSNGDYGVDSGSSGGGGGAAAAGAGGAGAVGGAGTVGGAVALGVLEDDFVVLASGGGVSGPSREGNGAEAVQYDDEGCKRRPSGHRSADGQGNTMTSRGRGRAEGERVTYEGGEVGELEEEDGEEEEIPDLVTVTELAKDSLTSSMASAASARMDGVATTSAASTKSTAMAAVDAAPATTTLSKPAPPPPGPTASAIRGRGVGVDVVGGRGLTAAPRLLDEQFEIIAQKEYADADDDDDIFADASEDEDDIDGSAARGTASLAQYTDVLDEFLAEQAAFEEDEAVGKGQKSGGPGRSQQALQQPQQKQQEHKSGVTEQTGSKLSVPAPAAAAAVASAAGVEEEEYEEEEEEFIDPFLSDEEKEVWDCETIVSTYSNLSNHPGRIGVPSNPKRNGRGRAGAAVVGAGDDVNAVVRLVGRLRLPEGLAGDGGGGGGGGGAGGGAVVAGGGRLQQPGGRGVGRVRGGDGGRDAMRDGGKGAEQLCTVAPQRKKGETAEERKARKALVKAKAADARAAKKSSREAFRGEAVRAQRSAAQTIPQGVRLS